MKKYIVLFGLLISMNSMAKSDFLITPECPNHEVPSYNAAGVFYCSKTDNSGGGVEHVVSPPCQNCGKKPNGLYYSPKN